MGKKRKNENGCERKRISGSYIAEVKACISEGEMLYEQEKGALAIALPSFLGDMLVPIIIGSVVITNLAPLRSQPLSAGADQRG